MKVGPLIVSSLTMLLATATIARTKPSSDVVPHRIVFELTSDQDEAWVAVLNNVENVRKALGSASIEVVAHGKGLRMLTSSTNAAVRDRLQANADRGVVFAACENTMKRENVAKDDLVPFATTVDSGVAEIVRKQEEGWSYLRAGS